MSKMCARPECGHGEASHDPMGGECCYPLNGCSCKGFRETRSILSRVLELNRKSNSGYGAGVRVVGMTPSPEFEPPVLNLDGRSEEAVRVEAEEKWESWVRGRFPTVGDAQLVSLRSGVEFYSFVAGYLTAEGYEP